jgi:hypothetical protein
MSNTPHYAPQPKTRLLLMSLLQRVSLIILLTLVLLLVAVRTYPEQWVFPALPKITDTARGTAGDPVNIILVGNAARISASFARAGWLAPDPITPQSTARIVTASLAHRPYPTAPVSNLYVFGRHQDLAFEWPTNDVQNRGHIRIWRTSLQLGGQQLWLGAASYDHGIELNGRTGFPTHHISSAVDMERDTVGTDLARSGLVVAAAHEPYTPPVFVAYNGGGDYYASDGDILLVSLSPAVHSLPMPTGLAAPVAAVTRGLFGGYDAVLTTLPLAVAAVLVSLVLVALALWPVISWLWQLIRSRGNGAAVRVRGVSTATTGTDEPDQG